MALTKYFISPIFCCSGSIYALNYILDRQIGPAVVLYSGASSSKIPWAYEQVQKILVFIALASNEGPDESAHMRRLAWVFAARMHKKWI